MRHVQYIAILCALLLFCLPCIIFAQDTTFNRVVTVERDYQPEIENANIIRVKPSIIEVEVNPNPVIYSTYSNPLSIGFNLHPLQAAALRFTAPSPTNGLLDAAIGHHNTHFDFNYKIHQVPNLTANVYAKHNAYWGSSTLSHSKIGGNGTYDFKKAKLYFGIDASNAAYSLIGQQQLQSLYQAAAYLGICSKEQFLKYNIQTGYKAFFTPFSIEHQIRSMFDLSWNEGQHQGGIKVYVQNNLYTSSTLDLKDLHNIRLQPFYELEEAKFKLHAGINLDMNIGTKQLLSASNNISFAPSPNIQFEWSAIPDKLHLHTEINGYFSTGTIDESMHLNRYFDIAEIAAKRDARTYVPVAASLGLIARPLRTLLIDLYGGYSLYINDYTMLADLNNNTIKYSYLLHNYQRGHIGAELNYHFRDIIKIKAKGHYYFWKNLSENMPVYDRPNWDASLRIDIHIDQNWSIYSNNKLEGKRLARTTLQDEKLPMIVDLNIGAQYDINRWLNVYLQLGNYLHRKNPIYYGYYTQGCHFLAGVKYVF